MFISVLADKLTANDCEIMAIKYTRPKNFMDYTWSNELFSALVDAKAGAESLQSLPYQKSWMEPLRELELKNEVAGTSMIEGATFVGEELEEAFVERTAAESATRSQRQVTTARRAYQWLAEAPSGLPVEKAIREIHRLIVTGCDDDHCEPGALRREGQNVIFGRPPHRGAGGGAEAEAAFGGLTEAAATYFRDHDPMLGALALHYHLAAIHPFQDGNGRNARAMEAYLLRGAGYSTHGFVGLSNYYYEERNRYMEVLAETHHSGGDLTAFFIFALKGMALQCARIRNIILRNNKIVLFKNMMYRVYNKSKGRKRRLINDRQLFMLEFLLEQDNLSYGTQNLLVRSYHLYKNLKNRGRAMSRDLIKLESLGGIEFTQVGDLIAINLDWPQIITDTEIGKEKIEKPSKIKLSDFSPL